MASILDSQEEPNEDCIYEMKVFNVKSVSAILKVLQFKQEQNALCFVSDKGLRMVVEDAKCVQLSAYIGTDIFFDFSLKEPHVVFKINLSTMLDCLTIFDNCPRIIPGSTTTLKMFAKSASGPLQMILEQDGVITECELKLMEPDEPIDFDLSVNDVINKVIMNSVNFKEVFTDLDASSDCVEILMSPEDPYFLITTFGICGDCQITISPDCDMVTSFQCTRETKFRYQYSQIKPILKPLAASTKVSIKTDINGLLGLQFMIHTEDKQLCYVQFFCTPLVEED